jgi:hypothetical protein
VCFSIERIHHFVEAALQLALGFIITFLQS